MRSLVSSLYARIAFKALIHELFVHEEQDKKNATHNRSNHIKLMWLVFNVFCLKRRTDVKFEDGCDPQIFSSDFRAYIPLDNNIF